MLHVALHECYDIALGIVTLVVPQDGEERHLQNPAHHFKHELEEEHRSKVQGCLPPLGSPENILRYTQDQTEM